MAKNIFLGCAIIFLFMNKIYAQDTIKKENLMVIKYSDIMCKPLRDSCVVEFERDLGELQSLEHIGQLDSVSFIRFFEYHKQRVSNARESYVDQYMDSLLNIQHIYFKRYNTAEEYAIMLASSSYCMSAIDAEWIWLNWALLLYYFQNKIYAIEEFATLISINYWEELCEEVAYMCAAILAMYTCHSNKILYKYAYPYFYNKYGTAPFDFALK